MHHLPGAPIRRRPADHPAVYRLAGSEAQAAGRRCHSPCPSGFTDKATASARWCRPSLCGRQRRSRAGGRSGMSRCWRTSTQGPQLRVASATTGVLVNNSRSLVTHRPGPAVRQLWAANRRPTPPTVRRSCCGGRFGRTVGYSRSAVRAGGPARWSKPAVLKLSAAPRL
jgi:hypothetical protein